MPGEGGAVSSSSYRRRNFFGEVLSHPLLFPVCGTVTIFLILGVSVRGSAGDSNQLFNFFQIVSAVFFAALLLRMLLRPGQACDKTECGAEISSVFGVWAALAAGALSYWRTLPLSFLCDDYGHIESSRHSFLVAIVPEFTKGQGGVFYRPLAFVSLFLDYRLWHNWVPGYHLTSILLHLVSVAGLFYLCRQFELKSQVCFAAALLFAAMPVNVQTVTWMAARFDQMAAAFGIWSVASAARFYRTRNVGSYWSALVLFVLAVLSKENAYVVPVLWLSMEFSALSKGPAAPSAGKRISRIAGYLATPALMLLFRLLLLRGIGGYRSDDAPMALHFPAASLFGLLVRAPGEMLFGWDWLAVRSQFWILVAVLTAAVFLTLALRMKTSASSRRLILFALVWIFISAAPAHFYFWSPDPGLFVSRTLYFGAMGLALLIAVLLDEAIPSKRAYQAWTVFVGILLFTGTQLNISAWQRVTGDARDWLAELKHEQPSPPPGVTYYIKGVPDQVIGVPYFAAGLESAVRSQYSWREDIHVVTDRNGAIPDDALVLEYVRPGE